MSFPSLAEHPLFAADTVWVASGWYVDGAGHAVPAEGSIRVSRHPEAPGAPWVVDRHLRLLVLGEPVGLAPLPGHGGHLSLHIRAELTPPDDDGALDAYWLAEDSGLGALAGRFTVATDSLLSAAASEDGAFVLTDWFLLTEEGCYAQRGTLSHDGETVGAWALTLEPGPA